MTTTVQAIAMLYETFAPYRIGDDFTHCECCVPRNASHELASKPLRRLTYQDLEHYSRKAMTTWGEVRHFKHFVPRLLELAIEHRDGFLDLAVLFGKLRYAQWQLWTPQEIEAVDAYLQAYWVNQLRLDIESPYSDAIDTVLCAEASALDSVKPLLAEWLAEGSLVARKHLAAFVLGNADCLVKKSRLSNPFWDYVALPHAEVLAWLKSPEVRTYLQTAALPTEFQPAVYQVDAIRSALEKIPS